MEEVYKMIWYEQLPEQCPPMDAQPCGGTYYRIANGNPVTEGDFYSQRKLHPNKVFTGLGVDECIARSISLFADVKKTFSDSHYSWWRTVKYNVLQAKIVEI